MSVLFEKLSAAEIEKRLQELKGQQEAAELDVAGREAALEGVLASGGNGDKAIDEIGKARTRVATLKAVLGKGAVELQAARDREGRAAEAVRLKGMTVEMKKKMAVTRAGAEKLLVAVKAIDGLLSVFDSGSAACAEFFGDEIFKGASVCKPIGGPLIQERIAAADWCGRQTMFVNLSDFSGWLTAKVESLVKLYGTTAEGIAAFAERRCEELAAADAELTAAGTPSAK